MSKAFLQNQTMGILKNSLDATSLRHKTVSNNIANINTPNYKRQVVNFEEELANYLDKKFDSLSLKTTNPRHISFNKNNYWEIKPTITRDTSVLRTDGNNVDIDLELAILSENTVKFNVLSQTINKKFSMLRSVIRGGR
jgi:flagellar basal-body rod protein FlgB